MAATKKFHDEKIERRTYDVVDLTVAQQRLWSMTRAKFLWEQPGFAGVLYAMMDAGPWGKERIIFTKQVPIAATDGAYMLANPEEFFKFTLDERVFVMGHEVLHGIFNHMILAMNLMRRGEIVYSNGDKLPYDDDIMQIAMDLVINAVLVEGQVGVMPKGLYYDPGLVPHTMSVIDSYRVVYQKASNGGKGGQGGKGQGSGGGSTPQGNSGAGGAPKPDPSAIPGKSIDQHLKPGSVEGKPQHQAAAERNDAQWKTAVAAAMASAAAQGKLPSSLMHLFKEILEPKISWEEHIEAFFARTTGSGNLTWQRPDRRLIVRDMVNLGDAIYAPSRTGYGAECVVIGVDTSGSIAERVLDRFFGELSGILENVRPKRIVIIWCDAKVGRVDEAEEAGDLQAIRAKGAPGRGGTRFEPVFEEVQKLGIDQVDCLVYLTDGEGSFPKTTPRYPVLWGSIGKPKEHYPFGDVVMVPV